MARSTVADRLRHILDAIARIEAWTDGRTFDDYLADDMLRAAVERCLEIVSEASRHIPRDAHTISGSPLLVVAKRWLLRRLTV